MAALQTPSQPDSWTSWRVVRVTLILVFIVLGFWLLYRFYQVVFILLIAVVLGTVIRPLSLVGRQLFPVGAGGPTASTKQTL